MIKATMVCTHCTGEKDIPREELDKAVLDDNVGELNLCSDCMKLWSNAVDILKQDRASKFAEIQKQFGITE